jgi:hypothetical protein
MRHVFAISSLAVASFSLAACGAGIGDPLVCTSDFRNGIAVTVRDSVTGAPTDAGTMVLAVDGAFRDSTDVSFGSGLYRLVGERPGTYQLIVRHAGYRDWTRSGVQVTSNACHVNTTALTALLQR